MKISRNLIIFLLIFSLHLLCKSNGEYCGPKCSSGQPSIQFPFCIKDVHNESCGYPGFDVYCDNKLNNTLLELPSAGNFSIDYILYCSREIWLLDPENCLPKKLLSLDPTKISPFRSAEEYAIFSLYTCSGLYVNYLGNDIIYCLSGLEYTVISAGADTAVHKLEHCTLLQNIFAPHYHNFSLYRGAIYLTSDAPPSEGCDYPPSLPAHTNESGLGPAVGFSLAVVLGLGLPALTFILCVRCNQGQRINLPLESP